MLGSLIRVTAVLCTVVLGVSGLGVARAAEGYAGGGTWWTADSGRRMPASVEYPDGTGRIRIINADGAFDTKGNAFFSAIGSNGRACITCHQPASGMSLSVAAVRRRWQQTQGKDPLFSAFDGSNCPSLPQAQAASHSLLLRRGLIRIGLPWPPRRRDGTIVRPEFRIEVVSDPTGCNTDPIYGLKSRSPTVSVFRRPRPIANMKYLLTLPHGVPPHEFLFYNDKSLLPKDPKTGRFVSMQLMSDGRDLTLESQARDAAATHLQRRQPLTPVQVSQIVSFEKQIYVAQGFSDEAGPLPGVNGPPGLGPEALEHGAPAYLGNNPINRIFGTFSTWLSGRARAAVPSQKRARDEFRESVARGANIFYQRRFYIRDVGGYNDKGLGNPFKRSCGSGCHNTLLMGMDLAPGYMDLGLNNFPWSDSEADLPLFKVTCSAGAKPQSFLGRVIYTHDPGRALITGKCADVGESLMQQSRGLAARAPYFQDGSAANLRELVDFYDRRFNIGYTEREKRDLVNFLSVL